MYFLAVITIVLSILVVAGCQFGAENQEPEKSSQTIIGGSEFEGLPAVGALLRNGKMWCSATLIAPRKVLTAAHCLEETDFSSLMFVGGTDISNPLYSLKVSSIKIHPRYDTFGIRNDLGLVFLSQDAPVEPMALIDHIDESWVGTDLLFVGFGDDDGVFHSGSGIKRAVQMSIVKMLEKTFGYGSSKKNTCNGDSGGPSFFQQTDGSYRLVGVTSFGDTYCMEYGIHTRVDMFKDFIAAEENSTIGCQGEIAKGRCDGTTLVSCENNKIKKVDCKSQGKNCGYLKTQKVYACINGSPIDPCAGETSWGRCSGNTSIYCEDETIYTEDCNVTGRHCEFNKWRNTFTCDEPETTAGCKGETYKGRCEGNTLIWCQNDKLFTLDCGSNGNQCKYNKSTGYYGCAKGSTEDPCKGELPEGRCEGNIAIWCTAEKTVAQKNCTTEGKKCGYNAAQSKYACIDSIIDPCQGETAKGRCDGNTLIKCINKTIEQKDCASEGKICEYSSAEGYFACISSSAEDQCKGEGLTGRCDGNTLIWCWSGKQYKTDCTTQNKTCVFDSAKKYYTCQ